MRIYDISMGVQPGMPVWPGDPPVTLERSESIADGGHANVSRIACSVHVGTHVDAPIHFVEGAATVDRTPLKVLVGRVYVVHLPRADVLDARVLDAAGIPPRTRRVLFRTRNSTQWARNEASVALHCSAPSVEWLRKRVHLVGVDYLGCTFRQNGGNTPLPQGRVVVSKALPCGRQALPCIAALETHRQRTERPLGRFVGV
jgi:arylformamidase